MKFKVTLYKSTLASAEIEVEADNMDAAGTAAVEAAKKDGALYEVVGEDYEVVAVSKES